MTLEIPTKILAQQYPDRELRTIEPVGVGNRRGTAIAWFAETPPLVVQWSQDPNTLRVEATLGDAIRSRTAVPVPETKHVGTADGIGFALREHRAGGNLHRVFTSLARTDRRQVVETLGRYLGEVHAVFTFDRAGPLCIDSEQTVAATDDGSELPLTPEPESSDEWLLEYGRAAIDRLPPAFDPLSDQLRDCLRASTVAEATPRLFPWDFRPGNAVLAGTDVVAVLDWEGPLAAPPGLSVVKAQYLTAAWYDVEVDSLHRAFRDGYEQVRPWPTVHTGHRIIAIADSAMDSAGTVTRPGYPEYDREHAVAFHREALNQALSE